MLLFATATTSFAPPLTPTQPTARRARRLVAAEDEGGWQSRPLVPELQQVPGRTSPDTPKEERVPWDWKRFVKQSSEFIELPSLLPKPNMQPRAVAPGESFGALELFPLDDVVMGGASSSSFDNAARTWRGEVTTRNSGGFVGVRSKTLAPALDLTGASGVAIRVRPRGAPLRLKFILRDSTDFNGICWTASFDVGQPASMPARLLDGGAETVKVPLESLVPTIFARTIPDATLDRTNIVGVQFALSKFEYDGGLSPLFREGAFEIDILDVAAY